LAKYTPLPKAAAAKVIRTINYKLEKKKSLTKRKKEG